MRRIILLIALAIGCVVTASPATSANSAPPVKEFDMMVVVPHLVGLNQPATIEALIMNAPSRSATFTIALPGGVDLVKYPKFCTDFKGTTLRCKLGKGSRAILIKFVPREFRAPTYTASIHHGKKLVKRETEPMNFGTVLLSRTLSTAPGSSQEVPGVLPTITDTLSGFLFHSFADSTIQ